MPDNAPLARQGFMLVISAPSGTGKTTVTRELLALEKGINLSISATTRPPRPSETEGKDYYFLDKPTFSQRLQEGCFLEHAFVHGHYYGTPREVIEADLKAGKDVLFDIDWQGARQIKALYPQAFVSIFMLPPTFSLLRERLGKRGEDSEEIICRRMEQAITELHHWEEYDYVMINEDLNETVQAVRAILQAERFKRVRQPSLSHFISQLCEEKA